MYAYVSVKAGQREEYWNSTEYDVASEEFISLTHKAPRELATWRKHGNLHGWMCNLWMSRGDRREADDFNGVELELSWDDIHLLEQAVRERTLPETDGFFFGSGNTEDYRDYDLAFCLSAKAETFLGLKVFYNSSW